MMYTKKQDKFAATFEEKTKECPLYARNMLALENMEFSRKEINMTKKYDENYRKNIWVFVRTVKNARRW